MSYQIKVSHIIALAYSEEILSGMWRKIISSQPYEHDIIYTIATPHMGKHSYIIIIIYINYNT